MTLSPFSTTTSLISSHPANAFFRKALRSLAATPLLLILLACPLRAQQESDFTYESNGSAITITGYTGSATTVTVPGSIAGLPVTAIGKWVFQQNESITGVILPASVVHIREHAFNGCRQMKNISVPASLKTIERNAFQDCTSLEAITLPSSITRLENQIFHGCSSLENVILPESITYIGASAFAGCAKLSSISFPAGLREIGDYAFSECTSLATAFIPLISVRVGTAVYAGCTGVITAVIADGVAAIPPASFSGCSNLTSIHIPPSVTRIRSDAFAYCTSLANISLPSSLTSIEDQAFLGCSSLATLTIPGNTSLSGNFIFDKCPLLIEFMVPSGGSSLSSIDGVLFNHNQTRLLRCPEGKAGEISVPFGVTTLKASAFSGCSKLTTITLPEGLDTIEANAFAGCTSLDKILIPSSVKSIHLAAIRNCQALTEVSVAPGNTSYHSIDGVLFDKNIKSLIHYPQAKHLEKFTIPESVSLIESGAFMGSSRLQEIIFPEPTSPAIVTIRSQAFAECAELRRIHFSSGTTIFGSDIFLSCPSLEEIIVPESSRYLKSVDGVLFNPIQSQIICYPATRVGAYTLPASVSTIVTSAFSAASHLSELTIPSSVSRLPEGAFADCISLNKITFEGNAPIAAIDVFPNTLLGLQIMHYEGAEGFDRPPWSEYARIVLTRLDADLAIHSLAWNGGGTITLVWPAPPGIIDPILLADVVERSHTLGGWESIDNPSFTITGGMVYFTDHAPPADGSFYRVKRP